MKGFRRLLEILEVDVDRLQLIEQPTRFDKIILPDESYGLSLSSNYPSFFTNDYRETIDRIRDFAMKNRTPTSSKKLYYFYGRYQFGEERFAEYFKSKGYEIIQPENLTLDEQLNWLINCESFASTLGSCSHNSIFLRDGTEANFLTRAVNYFTACQRILDQVHDLKVNYFDSNLSIFASGVPRANCFIISPQLKRFFGDKWNGYEEEDFKIFLQYVKDSMNKGLVVSSVAMNSYKEIFSDFMEQLKQRKDLIAACDMPPRWEKFQPLLTYQTHVHMKGWGDGWKTENQFSNPLDQELEVLALMVNFPNHKIYYQVYFNEAEGWSQEVTSPEMAGTVDKRKPIYGMRVRLDEAEAKEFDILYRMHKFDDTWTPWAKNGEALYSYGQKLNAIQIKLEPVKPAEKDTKEFNYQSFLLKDDAIYLHEQRQDLTQIKKEVM